MTHEVPGELEICFFVKGHRQSYPQFVIQFPDGYEPVAYKEMGCDENGVYLSTYDGQMTRISHAEGLECYEHTEGAPALHLQMLDDMGDFHSECEIVRLDRETALALGA